MQSPLLQSPSYEHQPKSLSIAASAESCTPTLAQNDACTASPPRAVLPEAVNSQAVTPQAATPQAAVPQVQSIAAATPTGSTPGTVQLGSCDGLGKSLAVRLYLAKTDPAYESSFGPIAFERTSRSGLRLTGWTAISTAKSIWNKLEGTCSSLIFDNRSYWEKFRSKRKDGSPSSGSVMPSHVLRCFMVGKDKSRAGPHVVIICEKDWFRKAVSHLIVRTGVLDEDGFGCIGLPDKIELYGDSSPDRHCADHARLAPTPLDRFHDVQVSALCSYQQGAAIRVVPQPQQQQQQSYDPEQYADSDDDDGSEPDDVVGIDLFEDDLVDVESILCVKADIEAGSSPFPESHDHLFTSHEDANLDFTGGVTDHLIRERKETKTDEERPGSDSVRPTAEASGPASWSIMDGFQGTKPDWILYQLEPDAMNEQSAESSKDADPEALVLKTPSQMPFGRKISTASLGMARLTSSQCVIVVDLNNLVPGDYGSGAMSRCNGRFAGILIGTCPTLGEAYLLPLTAIMQDLREQSGLVMMIPLVFPAPGIGNPMSMRPWQTASSSTKSSMGDRIPHKFSVVGWDHDYLNREDPCPVPTTDEALEIMGRRLEAFHAKFSKR